jgi:hypothetical protein
MGMTHMQSDRLIRRKKLQIDQPDRQIDQRDAAMQL